MPQSVLVIDDSRAIQALVRARLSGEPLEMRFADTGAAGLAMAIENPPDLILLDINLGEHESGFDICAKLKSHRVTQNTPIVFLSGAAATEEKIRGLDMGAVDYVTKPFDPAELRARVRASLRTKYLMDLLATKAQIDGLTGLWNRRHFDERLRTELTLSARLNLPVSCMFVDVDHFKQVNDSYGHGCGDEVLRQVAGSLQEVARTTDLVCRYGGEEFAIVLQNTPIGGARILAERAREQIAALPLRCRGVEVPMTASFGIAAARLPIAAPSAGPAGFVPFDVEAAATAIVTAADNAMYQAKRAGRNRVVADDDAQPTRPPLAA